MKKDSEDTFEPETASPTLAGSYDPPRITFEESLEAVASACGSPGFKVQGRDSCSMGVNS